jgi:6-phosphofructokinase 2
MMVSIYTLTLSPSLDSATLTPQIYPEGKLRCSAPVFEPGGGGINVARAITHLGGKATAIFPAGGATGEHLVSLLADEQVAVEPLRPKTGRGKTCMFTWNPAASSTVCHAGRETQR